MISALISNGVGGNLAQLDLAVCRQQLAQRRQLAGVENIPLLQPATPCLTDAVAKVVKVQAAVGIRVDTDQHALLARELAMRIQQVKPFRVVV